MIPLDGKIYPVKVAIKDGNTIIHHIASLHDSLLLKLLAIENSKKADFDKIAEQYHISPVTARIIRNRGLEDMEDIGRYLYGSVEQLHNPHLLAGHGPGSGDTGREGG